MIKTQESPVGSGSCDTFSSTTVLTRMELHKKGNPRVAGAEPVRWFVEA